MVPPIGTTKDRKARHHIYPAPTTTKTKVVTRVEPLQPPKEPNKLKLDNAAPRTKPKTKAKKIMVNSPKLPEEPHKLKLDEAKTKALMIAIAGSIEQMRVAQGLTPNHRCKDRRIQMQLPPTGCAVGRGSKKPPREARA